MNDKPNGYWNNGYIRIFKNKGLDDFFEMTNRSDVKPEYWDKFEGIRAYYELHGYMSPKQAQTLEWAIKKKRSRGVSASSFRGLPRAVNERIY